ncbi:hypothetical protein [Geodermatophilus marinus]|uniref:hypothetical protein n=1 Tax=Geodermatophilus sp. LHW52908 TaxID=2303986 RepID=UPI000E3DB139|nr:hypothetical protein [Geodermatophilus sp. LHW52908]RFU19274.1 hypothetical protein D0Z06_22085 [Geodermatophilus sp. LHW52908]
MVPLGPACDPDMSQTCPVTGRPVRSGGGEGSAVVLVAVLGVALVVAGSLAGTGAVLAGGVALAGGLLLARHAARAARRGGVAVPGPWADARRA